MRGLSFRVLLAGLVFAVLPRTVNSFLFIKSQLHLCVHKWFHPPKTGSIFCLSIQHACNETDFMYKADRHTHLTTYKGCATLNPGATYRGTNWHHPFRNMHEVNKYITILRNPKRRTFSSFCDYMHMDGMKGSDKERILSQLNYAPTPEACVQNYNAYMSANSNIGCYTKMLNGYECCESVKLTAGMVRTAKHFLKHFFFVGILEDYDNAVKLFLKMNKDTVFQPYHEVEMTKVRASEGRCCPVFKNRFNCGPHLKNSSLLYPYDDPFDNEVYAFALQRFEADKRAWGVS